MEPGGGAPTSPGALPPPPAADARRVRETEQDGQRAAVRLPDDGGIVPRVRSGRDATCRAPGTAAGGRGSGCPPVTDRKSVV